MDDSETTKPAGSVAPVTGGVAQAANDLGGDQNEPKEFNKDAEMKDRTAAVPDDVIPVMLPHPQNLGSPISRGVRYKHHFEVELISDGRRLWAMDSEEGAAVAVALKRERESEQEALQAARSA